MARIVRDPDERSLLTTARDLRISKKRLLGWEPTETHVYTHDDAGRVASVTVTREPEWDDESREEMLALAEYEAGVCDCGFHFSIANDESNVFSFKVTRCPVCAGAAGYSRLQESDDRELDARLGPNPEPTTPRRADGRQVRIAMTPPGLSVAE